MKIKCTSCGALYDVNPASIPPKGRYAKCGQCQHRFFVKGESASKTPTAARKSLNFNGLIGRVPIIATGLILLLLLLGVAGYFLLNSVDTRERKRIANTFLEALKTQELTEENAWDHLEKYLLWNFS